MRYLLLFVLIILNGSVFSQKTIWDRVDTKVAAIPESAERSIPSLAVWIESNFTKETDRIRAIQRWIAMNLRYDFNMTVQRISVSENAEIISSAFKSRKAVCGGYAGLMDSLCRSMDIKSYIIDGYTIQDDHINPSPHAWVAAQMGGNWYLFDPTWSSGSLVNGTYEHVFDEQYFMVTPDKMILSHIPFDPIWQFLEVPVFQKKMIKAALPRFSYADSIQHHLQLNEKQKITDEIRRINQYMETNQAIAKRLSFLYENLDVELYNEKVNLLNISVNLYNEAIGKWDSYIDFRNRNLDDIEKVRKKGYLLDEILALLEKTNAKLQLIHEVPSEMTRSVFDLRNSVRSLGIQIKEEKRLTQK
jgi:hypothetical protein